MKKGFYTLLFVCCCTALFGQVPKKMMATRIDRAPKIDGQLNDVVWKNAPIFSDFVELKPNPGRKEAENQRTEIRILYDDVAIYIAARMYESNVDSIAHEFAARDQVGNADYIGVVFDTYFDKINANGFYVTAAGSQFDAKYSTDNEDENWNAVWESAVSIDAQGWSAEFKIPYSALRFSSNTVQNWGINFSRQHQKANQQLFWNPLNPAVNGFINQEGELENLQNIKAPLRLSFSPYVSSYVNHYPSQGQGISNTTSSFNGGMDVKYGINQSFTLDMTLVPDFGQVRSDNQVLNLSPFEVKFDENRSFFTEGTELFSKGDLFYSRRVGARPINFYEVQNQLQANEYVVENPSESRLLNATKISGRTAQGLGIGFFNALTNKMEAVVENNLGERRFIETQPLSNYNILVFDQTLKNNSSVSFINTNVTREGSAFDANLSAFLFNINDKKNTYFANGSAKLSKLSRGLYNPASAGTSYQLKAGKQSGNFNWNVGHGITDDKFDPNDMGILFTNNSVDNWVNLQYNLFKPGKWYNRMNNWFEAYYSLRYKPNNYQSSGFNFGSWVQLKSFNSFNYNFNWEFAGNDFFEPRQAGRVYKTLGNKGFNVRFNSNRSKRYSAGAFVSMRFQEQFNGRGYAYGCYQNFRVNDKLAFGADLSVNPQFNYTSYLDYVSASDEIIFSRYDRRTVESSIDGKYSFSTKMGIQFRARHYWSDRRNKQAYALTNEGGLQAPNSYVLSPTADVNYNTFNIDMVYTWQFSLGSEFSVTWKNAAQTFENMAKPGYGINFNNTLKSPQNNTVSLKLLYYIDYLNLRKRSS